MEHKLIANGWNEMPLGLWIKEQEILRDQETDAIDKNVRLVALMYDMTEAEAYNTELNEFSKMLDSIGWLAKEPQVPQVSPQYNINGKVYNVCLNPNKITTAQYIDFKAFNIDDPNNIPMALSVIMIPDGHNYNEGYELEDVKNDIMDYLRVPHALSIVRFFFQYYKALTQNSLRSLIQILKKEARRTKDREKRNQIKMQIEKTEALIRTFGSL